MKNYILHTPEGVRDITGLEANYKDEIERSVKSLVKTYGYDFIETPTFEYLDVFTLGSDSVQNPRIYKWINQQGELVALKSDMTKAIARVVATQNNKQPYPQRYAYVANSFRYPERYQGKAHEFTQAGIELIGDSSSESDAEVIYLAIESLQAANIKDFVLHIGSATLLSCLIREMGCSEDAMEKIYQAIDEKDAVALSRLVEEEATNKFLAKDLFKGMKKTGDKQLLVELKEKVQRADTLAALTYLEALYENLAAYEVNQFIVFDFSMLSYARYYTGVMFQAFVEGVGTAVVEGGRYDHLLLSFGKNLPAVGFGLHIDAIVQKRLAQATEEDKNRSKTLVVYTKDSKQVAFAIAKELRRQGCMIENALTMDIDTAIAYGNALGMGGILHFLTTDTVEVYNLVEGNSCRTTPQHLV